MSDEKKAELKKVCGWCGQDLGTITIEVSEAPKTDRAPIVSHGICEPCSEEWIADAEVFLRT